MPKLRLFAAVLSLVAAPAAAMLPSQVYVFGDSFVDSGNAFIGSGGFAAPPSQGYFQGRFGDGYNFADFISKRLTGDYATAFLAGGQNFAVGGARAGSDRLLDGFVVPGLVSQAGLYIGANGQVADPNGLYIINFGNNDVSAILTGDTGGLTPAQYAGRYVSNIVGLVGLLDTLGATRIVVLGVPDGSRAEGVALQAQLDAGLDSISPFLDAQLTRFDYFDFFDRLVAHPTRFGLTADVDFTTPCNAVRPVTAAGIDCTGFFSFDGIHVTEPVQFEIARAVLTQAGLPTVPDAAVWIQLIAGFGLTGFVLRRRAGQDEMPGPA